MSMAWLDPLAIIRPGMCVDRRVVVGEAASAAPRRHDMP
jgi:hypothetical protein